MTHLPRATPPLWLVMGSASLAGGMGWGIRGQYGHETGAMIAGALVSLVLVFLCCPRRDSLPAIRAVALGTIAMGFGGSMTYGQTVGLTHDANLVGNWSALAWGLLGLAIKGGIWIGFAGLFLGMGLGGRRHRSSEMLVLVLAMLGAVIVGWWLFNAPHDPANRRLPALYFSDHWRWEPGVELKHRPEIWGGLGCALLVGLGYASVVKRDRLARNLALWGVLGGALGFPLGQCLQAAHAWSPETFRVGALESLTRHVNWWNLMETTFGAILGALLGLGLWRNRALIETRDELSDVSNVEDTTVAGNRASRRSDALAGVLLATHLALLLGVEFGRFEWIDGVYDLGLVMGLIPLVACVEGRWWPFLLLLPVTLLPIAGKTLRELVFRAESATTHVNVAWLAYLILPLLIASTLAVRFFLRRDASGAHPGFTRVALLFSTWVYFGLNHAFFGYPVPWQDWTGRTPSAIAFSIATLGLTTVALFYDPERARWSRRAAARELRPVPISRAESSR